MDFVLSKHAEHRLPQRAISQAGLEIVLSYGHILKSSDGAEICHLRRDDWREVVYKVGPKSLARARIRPGIYAVMSQGKCVVTAGHRTERVWR
jgi:hypothetical protein